MGTILSPFGGEAICLDRLHVSELIRQYNKKCGVDITEYLSSNEFAHLYICDKTGYKFWYPYELAGSNSFYERISRSWPHYYRTQRWEYAEASKTISSTDRCLEIGCGRGFFIKLIENRCRSVEGMDFNQEAIAQKVCRSSIRQEDISKQLDNKSIPSHEAYDKIFAFQVLEHVVAPEKFISGCLNLLKIGGHLIISVPDDNYIVHRNMADPFNLPPHHMGCYSDQVFSKIADIYNLEITKISHQAASFPAIEIGEITKRSLLWKFYLKLVSSIGSKILANLREPGHTMLVIFKKKELK